MAPVNFTSQYPQLKWSSSVTSDSTQHFLLTLASAFRDDRRLFLPPIVTTGIIFVLLIPSSLYRYYNYSIQDQLQQYDLKSNQLSAAQAGNKAISQYLTNVQNSLLINSVSPFIFATLLQNLIPQSVQLKTYSIDNKMFYVQAASISQQSLNDFVSFLSDHPLIDSQSLAIDEIIATTIKQNSNQTPSMLPDGPQSQTTQPLQVYELKLTGKYKKVDLKELISLAKQTGALGQLAKLNTLSLGDSQ